MPARWVAVGVLLMTVGCVPAAPPAAPTMQDLMDPALFANPQRGLLVERFTADGDRLRITTTGADIAIDAATGDITFRQRIGHQRTVAVLHLGRPLRGLNRGAAGPGLNLLTCEQPRLSIRVNGDSLFMLHVHEPLTAAVERRIDVAWQGSDRVNHLLADEWGGFGLYCSDTSLVDHYDPYEPTVATYPLPADAVLWVAVCPPQAYPWERSFQDNVVWHWSNQLGYPSDETLKSWADLGNIVLLQSEVMLWKDWNLDFVPRLGPDEFARVRRTLHAQNQRFIVYTSPYYFLRGTPLEDRAMNSFENFQGWPPGDPTGVNMELFMTAIGRVMKDYQPDGLYFDGQYTSNPAALYALARRTRALLGEDGILEWHSTGALGSGDCYLPQADCYTDFILRGEGRGARYQDFDYLRYFISGYNLNNTIGVVCNNGPPGITSELVRDALRANARFHTLVGWTANPDLMRIVDDEYKVGLNPALRDEVDRGVDQRQAEVAAKAAARLAERETLRQPPQWAEPVYRLTFEQMPAGAEQHVSPQNTDPFSAAVGALRVRGHGNTYAYLSLPLNVTASGFVVKLRHGTDAGMSWGPGAALRWADGGVVRVGTRSEGKLQADVLGTQYYGFSHELSQWTWLRARWSEHLGVIESSRDGTTWERLWTFEHPGTLLGPPQELLVGKVPFNGEPHDYSEPGPIGDSDYAWVEVYGG